MCNYFIKRTGLCELLVVPARLLPARYLVTVKRLQDWNFQMQPIKYVSYRIMLMGYFGLFIV